MRAWIYRNRHRLEAILGRPGRPRPLTEPAGPEPEVRALGRPSARRPWPKRVVVYDLRPAPPALRRAG